MLSMGVVLENVNFGIKFQEKPIFKSFVSHNIDRRNRAMSILRSRHIKLTLNMITGRVLINSANFPRKEFCLTSSQALDLFARHTCKSFERISDDLTIFEMEKSVV